MYKVLIIDDQIEQRKPLYEKIFENRVSIDLFFSDKMSIISKIAKEYFDCALIDEQLNIGDSQIDILNAVARANIPIIMVSEKREYNIRDYQRTYIADCISLVPVFQSLTALNEVKSPRDHSYFAILYDSIREDFINRIKNVIWKNRGDDFSDSKLGLMLCHISDLQFGDPHVRQENLLNFFTMLKSYFKDSEVKPHLFVFSGDIGFSGKRDELTDDVKKIVMNCFESIYSDGSWQKHLLFVPGNHDFCYSESLIHGLIDSELGEGKDFCDKSDPLNIKFKGFTPSDFEIYAPLDISRYYFSKFCYELTSNTKYWNTPFYIDIPEYMDLGFRIIGISNADSYSRIGNSLFYEFRNDQFNLHLYPLKFPTIVVGHASPNALGYNNTCEPKSGKHCIKDFANICGKLGDCQKWNSTKIFLEDANGVVYLHGHGHHSDALISKDKRNLFLSASAPNRINSSESSFSVLNFTHDDSTLTVRQRIVSNLEGTFKDQSLERYSYDLVTQKWSEAP